jgi:hypothetical protein
MHQEKEDNWEIVEKAEKKNFQNTVNLVYLGYEVEFEIEIFEDGTHKVLKICGKDVSDKNITI